MAPHADDALVNGNAIMVVAPTCPERNSVPLGPPLQEYTSGPVAPAMCTNEIAMGASANLLEGSVVSFSSPNAENSPAFGPMPHHAQTGWLADRDCMYTDAVTFTQYFPAGKLVNSAIDVYVLVSKLTHPAVFK